MSRTLRSAVFTAILMGASGGALAEQNGSTSADSGSLTVSKALAYALDTVEKARRNADKTTLSEGWISGEGAGIAAEIGYAARMDPPAPTPIPQGGHARIVSGQPVILSGNVIEVEGQAIRIHGVLSPKAGDECLTLQGLSYDCTAWAIEALGYFLGEGSVLCHLDLPSDETGLRGICRIDHPEAGTMDLGEWMVRSGSAIADAHGRLLYADSEAEAKRLKRGLWSGWFQPRESKS